MQTQVVTEVADNIVGEYTGQCKWFNDKLGYGFITIQDGNDKGKDIFVHHSGIKPLNSNYKTLKKGEYINFGITNGDNGLQAINVTGICGGSLMCDVTPSIKQNGTAMHIDGGSGVVGGGGVVGGSGFTVVVPRRNRYPYAGGRGGGRGGRGPGIVAMQM